MISVQFENVVSTYTILDQPKHYSSKRSCWHVSANLPWRPDYRWLYTQEMGLKRPSKYLKNIFEIKKTIQFPSFFIALDIEQRKRTI